MTEFGEIPSEWEVCSIEQVISFMKSGLSRNLKDDDVGIPCIRSNNIVNGRINNKDLKYWFLEDDKGANIKDYILDDGDVLVNFINSMAQIGKTCIYRNIGRDVIYTTNIFRLKFNNKKIITEYFYHFSQTERYKKSIELITKPAVNQASFTTGDFKSIKLAIPTIKEQEKIASILSTVDEQIDNVDGLIEKNKELKKGLMQQLLTNGIGHTKFKETEIGDIPEEWGVDSGFIKIKSGFGFKLKEYVHNGVPLIRINNVMYGKITEEDLSYLPEEYIESYNEFILKKGDILLALNRPITNNRLKIGVVTKEPSILYQRVGKLQFDTKRYLGAFFFQYMQSDKFINLLENSLVGSDQPYIKTSEFENLKFAVPSIEEQEKIASILSEVDEKIEVYEVRKRKLEELKRGLMQQLLTGKIRVI